MMTATTFVGMLTYAHLMMQTMRIAMVFVVTSTAAHTIVTMILIVMLYVLPRTFVPVSARKTLIQIFSTVVAYAAQVPTAWVFAADLQWSILVVYAQVMVRLVLAVVPTTTALVYAAGNTSMTCAVYAVEQTLHAHLERAQQFSAATGRGSRCALIIPLVVSFGIKQAGWCPTLFSAKM